MLARLVGGDPLELRALCARVTDERRYLIDVDRVFLRAAARTARFALRYRGQPELDEWLTENIDAALLDIVADDSEIGDAPRDPSALDDFARPLGLDPDRVHLACAAFNRLPSAERSAYWVLMIRLRSLDEAVVELGGSATEIARSARRALDTLIAVLEGKESA